ncbi:MAG: hypothetical protein K6U14_04240 [Firmicutes bacterium]|nr:hypothetical protein [Alicyclobacillaceae bacterium]MCL6496830.1 hypothetical protein [Bacillota bacterium]
MKFSRRPGWVGMVLGGLLGAGLATGVMARQVSACQAAARSWQATAYRWQTTAARLGRDLDRLNWQASQQPAVETVSISVLPGPVPAAPVVAALRPFADALLGTAIDRLTADAVFHLFDGRIVAIGDGLYRISVRALVVAPRTEILVTVRPLAPAHAS